MVELAPVGVTIRAIDALRACSPSDIVVDLLPLTPQTESSDAGSSPGEAGSLLVNAVAAGLPTPRPSARGAEWGRIRAALDVPTRPCPPTIRSGGAHWLITPTSRAPESEQPRTVRG